MFQIFSQPPGLGKHPSTLGRSRSPRLGFIQIHSNQFKKHNKIQTVRAQAHSASSRAGHLPSDSTQRNSGLSGFKAPCLPPPSAKRRRSSTSGCFLFLVPSEKPSEIVDQKFPMRPPDSPARTGAQFHPKIQRTPEKEVRKNRYTSFNQKKKKKSWPSPGPVPFLVGRCFSFFFSFSS